MLLNKGNGTFGAATSTPATFNGVNGLAAGDFNNDGKLDIALTDSAGGTVSVFLGNGAGMFPTEHDYVAGDQATGLFAMDLDGDGNLDVVIASGHPDMLIPNENSQFITAFLGKGDGTLIGPPAFHAGNSPNAIATADFNGDGILDVASAAGQLWIGIAGEAPVSVNLGSGVSASGVAAADINGDGKPDIVVGDANGSGVYVLLGNGDGTFQAPVKYSTGGGDVNSVAIADFNGDGKPDIAFCGFLNLLPPVGAAGILFGNGNGTFQAVTNLSGFGASPAVLAAGDFNHDGKPDLAILDQGYQSAVGGVNVYLNNGNGTFQMPVSYTAGQYPVFLAAADVNGDGVPDLLVSTQDPNYNTNAQWDVAVLLAKGNGTFQAPSYLATQTNPNAVAIGDVNGDGKPDLAIGHCCIDSNITYMLGNGDGTFQAEAAVLTPVEVTALAAADLNGSGPADLIAGMGLRVGYVSYFLNLASLTPPTTPITIQTFPEGLQFTVDGGAAQSAPQTLNLTQGSHTITAASPQAGATGSRYEFSSWSDGTTTTTDTITVGTSGVTYTATFTTQYQLTVAASPAAGGTVTPATGSFYNSGTAVNISATPNSGYGFNNWTGPVGSAASVSTTVTMIAPETVTANFTAATTTSGLAFYAVTPCRLADTRIGQGLTGQFGPPSMIAGQTRSFTIPSSACNIPTSAQAYSLNVTVVPAATLGYLTIWPTGQTQPYVSTLNSLNGAILANAAIVPAGTSGAVSVFVTDATDLIIDINGYFAPPTATALAFYPVPPCRVADTRNPNGAFGGPSLPAGGTRTFTVPSSACGIPAAAQAYSLNMTAVPPGPVTYLTAWPTGQTQPNVSTLNALQGQIAANAAIVPAGTNGAVNVFVSDASNVLMDIDGYFGPPGSPGALYFYPLTPCRIADTRNAAGTFGGPSLPAGGTRTFPIPSSSCGLPSTAQAYSLNMTVVPPGSLLYLSTWPAGQTQPVVSTLNDLQGQIIANAAIVPAGTSGGISVYVSDATNLVIDINGYFGQ